MGMSPVKLGLKEQFGRVLVEAMACEVPVIGSSSGEIPTVVGDAGLVFPEGDAAGLARCIQQYRSSPELAAECARRGYERACANYTGVVVVRHRNGVAKRNSPHRRRRAARCDHGRSRS